MVPILRKGHRQQQRGHETMHALTRSWRHALVGVLTGGLVLVEAMVVRDSAAAGYGAEPRAAKQVIAEAGDALRVDILLPPRPHSIRDPKTGRWLYGWRVCAHLEPGDRVAFFLLDGDRILYRLIEPIGADGLGARSVADLCGLPLPLRTAGNRHRPRGEMRSDPLLGGG